MWIICIFFYFKCFPFSPINLFLLSLVPPNLLPHGRTCLPAVNGNWWYRGSELNHSLQTKGLERSRPFFGILSVRLLSFYFFPGLRAACLHAMSVYIIPWNRAYINVLFHQRGGIEVRSGWSTCCTSLASVSGGHACTPGGLPPCTANRKTFARRIVANHFFFVCVCVDQLAAHHYPL